MARIPVAHRPINNPAPVPTHVQDGAEELGDNEAVSSQESGVLAGDQKADEETADEEKVDEVACNEGSAKRIAAEGKPTNKRPHDESDDSQLALANGTTAATPKIKSSTTFSKQGEPELVLAAPNAGFSDPRPAKI